MKIAFTGSHGTGKTTLAKKLSEDLNIHLITNISRNYYKSNGIENFEILTKEERWGHQHSLFSIEILEEIKNVDFVTDRSIIDFLAYTILYSEIPLKYKSKIIEIAKINALMYDYLFYLPVEITYIPEKGRASKETQKEIDECILSLIESLELPYFKVEGTLEERLNLIKKVINK